MIKAIFFDVDGTLLSHTTKSVPDSAREALKKLREQGIKTVLATGRHMLELERLPVSDIPFDGYITLNGQLCLDGRKRLYSGSPISGQDTQRLVAEFEKEEIPIMLVEKDGMYINFIDDSVRQAHESISTPLPRIGRYGGGSLYQVIAYVGRDRENKVTKALEHSVCTRWSDFGIDIISNTGGKASGIRLFLEQNGISREESMAFGDGENDIAMLRFVRIGIAMENGDENVKQSADDVTASVDHDGIALALRKYSII